MTELKTQSCFEDTKEFTAIEEDFVSEKDNLHDTYFVMKWDNIFTRSDIPTSEDIMTLKQLFIDSGSTAPVSDIIRADLNEEAELTLDQASLGKIDIGQCREQLKKAWGLEGISDERFDTTIMALNKISDEHVEMLQELNKVMQESEHVKVLVVGSPLFYQEYAVHMQVPELFAQDSKFEFIIGKDHDSIDTDLLIEKAIAAEDISSNSVILGFNDGDEELIGDLATNAIKGDISVDNYQDVIEIIGTAAELDGELPASYYEVDAPIGVIPNFRLKETNEFKSEGLSRVYRIHAQSRVSQNSF
jgi:hypothetical protein